MVGQQHEGLELLRLHVWNGYAKVTQYYILRKLLSSFLLQLLAVWDLPPWKIVDLYSEVKCLRWACRHNAVALKMDAALSSETVSNPKRLSSAKTWKAK